MEEFYWVLEDGGMLEIKVPSTEGKNAFANPNYRSHYNELSWSYFIEEDMRLKFGTNAKFDLKNIEVIKDQHNIVFVNCTLIVNKPKKDEMM